MHVSELLRQHYRVSHFLTTTCAGVNRDLANMAFYRGHIDREEEDVLRLFDKARADGLLVSERGFDAEHWRDLLVARRVVLIVLVDNRTLSCTECPACLKRNWLGCSFCGHYIVVVGWDGERGAFAYRDPASRAPMCWMRPRDFDRTRLCKGTDEDVVVVPF